MLELFFVRILRQQENLGVKKQNNCSYSFRLQVSSKLENGVLAARLEGMARPDPEQLFPETRTRALGGGTCWA